MIVVGILILLVGVWLLRAAWYCATVGRDFIGLLFFGLLGVPITFIGFMVSLAALAIT